MKKQLLTIGLAVFSLSAVNAQTFVKNQKVKSNRTEIKSKGNSVEKAVTGSLVCNTQYVAGTTMDLEFTLNLTNTDFEYCDLFSITFPAGITPNSGPNTIYTATENQPDETLNAISGQTISWGDNDNNYGGIEPGNNITFNVNVTIAGGTTGNLNATFLASGDGYANPADLNGSVTIYPFGATVHNIEAFGVMPATLTSTHNCGMGSDDIIAGFINKSTEAVSNIPVKYSINGGTAVMGTIAGPVAVGDTAYITFGTQGDFSAQNLYELKAWSEFVGDVDNSNDSTTLVFTNSVSTNLETTVYSNGIESDYDFASILSDWAGTGLGFGLSSGTVHSGSLALYYTIPTNAPAADYETFAILPCMDVVNGSTYKISYWRKTNDTPAANGKTGIFVGSTQEATAMTNVIKAYTSITPNPQAGTWEKDSAEYVATSTGTVYFAIGGKGTVSANSQINVRLDDIKVELVSGNGLDNNSVEVSMYPNPTSGELNFNLNKEMTSVSIISADGKVIYSQNAKGNSTSVNVSNLNEGVYFYQINTIDGNTTTNKFVKK